MALLGKRDGHARVPYGTLGSERVNNQILGVTGLSYEID